MTHTATVKIKSGNKRDFDFAVKTVKSMGGKFDPETKIWIVFMETSFDFGVIDDPDYYGIIVLTDSRETVSETIIEQINDTLNTANEETETMTEITVTREMIAAGTAPKLPAFTPELREGETITLCITDEERYSVQEFRAKFPELCDDGEGNPLPDERIIPIIPSSTYIVDSNSPRIKMFWAEQEG